MRFIDFPVAVEITHPLIVMVGGLNEVILLRAADRTGKKI